MLQDQKTSQETAISFEDVLASRYSCRGYLENPVPPTILQHILRLAQRTPSWCNCQPWELIITSKNATEKFRKTLLEQALLPPEEPDFTWPTNYNEPYLKRRRECGFALYNSVGISKSDRVGRARQEQENFRFFGAPHVAIVTVDKGLGIYGAIDCGGYINTFMMAASVYGVASIAQASLASRPDFIRAYFGIPSTRHIVCGISFGYADNSHPANQFRTSRAELCENIQFIE
ncbi:MAG: nitroreductase [Burkholderiaceae bacterium]|nr:nitroreductase [Burkholderiaceae bacterium]